MLKTFFKNSQNLPKRVLQKGLMLLLSPIVGGDAGITGTSDGIGWRLFASGWLLRSQSEAREMESTLTLIDYMH
jgi:hypothetical protein